MANRYEGLDLPTTMRARMPDGRCIGADNSVWLYRKVPLGPVDDAVDTDTALAVGAPLMDAFDELESMARVRVNRRRMASGAYRQIHLQLVNIPRRFEPDKKQPLREWLTAQFPKSPVDRRVLLLGVRLRDEIGGGGGFAAMADSVIQTLVSSEVPLSDFDRDFQMVDAALSRAGLTTPSAEDFRLANAWWNTGKYPDTPTLVHSDHLHVFTSPESLTEAAALEEDRVPCRNWPKLPRHGTVSMVGVQDLNFRPTKAGDPGINWFSELMSLNAIAVSVRASIEPQKVTRAELRANRKGYIDDINEASREGKMQRSEQDETLAFLSEMEGIYAREGAATPTLVDASCVAALNGVDVNGRYDATGIGRAITLSNLVERQSKAMTETMLCSNVRANPHLHDWPAQAVAMTGAPSLSVVGDTSGALLGFTERDRQPAYISPTSASTADGLPMMLVAGQTGSGKTQAMLWMAYQFAQPCENPELENSWAGSQIILDPKALRLDTRVPTPDGWSTIGDLKVGDQVFGRDGQPCNVIAKSPVFTPEQTRLYEFHLDDGQVVTADQHHRWVVATMQDRTRMARGEGRDRSELLRLQSLVDSMKGTFGDSSTLPTSGLLVHLQNRGVDRWTSCEHLANALRPYGVQPLGSNPLMWPTEVALKALSAHLGQEAALGTDQLRVMTTDEILQHGLKTTKTAGGQTHFSIPVPAAVEHPQRELAVSPYLLGAWLGDGTAKSMEICVGAEDRDSMFDLVRREWPTAVLSEPSGTSSAWLIRCVRDTTRCLRGHTEYVVVNHGGDRGLSKRCATCERAYQRDQSRGREHTRGPITNGSLHHGLRKIGAIGNKHIPDEYLTASREQRMALLQGLMDTDGTVKRRGDLRISLTNEKLARGVLTLVRSLGYKGMWWEGDAVISQNGARRKTGTQYVITFRTTDPVFRLPRKRAMQQERTHETTLRSNMLYITDVKQVASDEAQCITVDSPDRTYLVEDFVVTHNTGSAHDDTVKAAGGQVVSLDDLMTADGVFDPLRFAGNAEAGIEAASSVLLQVNPWGGRKADFETDLTVALTYGVAEGATCVGQALKIALDAGRAKPEMVQPVLDLAQASPMFSACVGMDPKTEGLRVSEGITLIKVGDTHLDLPQPGKQPDSMGQRIGVSLVRMMVYGSAMALTGRRGVLHMDEAWIFLLGGASEVERLGRLARSQEVFPIMYTQRVSDAVNAGLTGYISRGLILAIKDKDEARAACELFELEPTPYRMGRITAQATKSGTDSSLTGAPNWNSLRALRDPETRKVLRGSVGIYVDLDGRAVPTVITLPPEFLKMSSTNTADLREKLEEKKRRAAQGLAEVMPLRSIEESHQQAAEESAEQMARHAQAMASSLDDAGDPETEPPGVESVEVGTGASVGEDDDWEELRNLG